MSKIKIMDTTLSNKIAAGEVVETLMNVVKELVENSIDAGARNIKVILKESGVKQIKVVDDGAGMNREDALLALKRHATSKIYSDEDLFNIHTLGFRGEALPSIASVSKMVLETSDGESGTKILVCGGKEEDVQDSSLRRGTLIEVNDLFYNTPARLKYLKSLHTELANITSYINRMALCYPNIKFSLVNDERGLLSTDGSGNVLKVINSIYGLDVTKKMIKISGENSDYEINGYISYPEVNRASRNFITLLVNGRYVKNNEITKTILEAYHTYLPINRYPVVVLNIEADPFIVDVNVHPTKMDVKFSKMEEIKELIYDVISKALHNLVLVPEVKSENKVISNILEVDTINDNIDFKKDEIKPEYEEIEFDFTICEDASVYEIDDIKDNEDKSNNNLKKINPVGIVHATYIIGENEDGMYIIDQHAAQERINYEYYLKELGREENEYIDLLIPIKLEFTNEEYIKLKDKFDEVRKLNISFEEFGVNTIVIRSHPKWLGDKDVVLKLRKIIEVILSTKEFSKEKFNEKIAITLSCKMAIKANDYISLEEASRLLDKLFTCDNPYNCPHGRPTIINYSYYELEKLFKRVM